MSCPTLAGDSNVARAGAARRRRERRLRSMLRHNRQTVAMELAATLHHSRDVGPEKNDGLRAQTTASSGKRPAPLEEVAEPQAKLVQHSGIGYELVLALDAPVLHMVEQPVDVLVRVDELLKKQEEEEEEEEEEVRRMAPDAPESAHSPPAEEGFRTLLSFLFSPRSSSSAAVACSRHHGWCGPVLTVFFSVVVDPGSGICWAGLAACSPRGVPCGCRQAQMPGIMAVVDQKDM